MKHTRELMKCGSCGESAHELWRNENNDIVVKCLDCKNESLLTVSKPKLEVKWVDGSDGIITVF